VEEPRKRPPRPKRPREVVRASLEVAAVSVLVIVVLTLVGVVLYKGGKRTAPPGDALVVTQTQDFASLDPALAQTREAWELEYATCAKLLNYPAVRGYRGTRLVPEVATALPSISRDRRTYTFRVRTAG
jgi:peptide/nickel transport system substrate-binding protein